MIDSTTDLPAMLYAGLNLLVFAIYAVDKIRAKVNAVRIPERYLLAAAALGPAGALLAMLLLRHKTRVMKFLLVPFFFILHVLMIVLVWPRITG
jgi:uncharacterized membrane protein YsdA (DUF1294 family)